MKAIGNRVKRVEMASFSTLTVGFIRVNSVRTNARATESTRTNKDQNMKASGRKTLSGAKEQKSGQKAPNIPATT